MKCEACNELEIDRDCGCLLLDFPNTVYNVCYNCLSPLVNTALSPEQFFNLLASGHQTKEFLLHSDFYDEEGRALQPR